MYATFGGLSSLHLSSTFLTWWVSSYTGSEPLIMQRKDPVAVLPICPKICFLNLERVSWSQGALSFKNFVNHASGADEKLQEQMIWKQCSEWTVYGVFTRTTEYIKNKVTVKLIPWSLKRSIWWLFGIAYEKGMNYVMSEQSKLYW